MAENDRMLFHKESIRPGSPASRGCLLCAFLMSLFCPSRIQASNLGQPAGVLSPASGVRNSAISPMMPWGFQRMRAHLVGNRRQSSIADLRRDFTSILLATELRGGSQDTAEKADKDDKEEETDSSVKEDGEDEDEEEEDMEADEDLDEADDEGDDESEDEDEDEEEEEAALEESSEFDEPLVASPMLGLYATFGVMMLSRKINLFDPMVVRTARFAFIGYLVLLQAFLLYVRIRAKTANDRTPIKLTNPVTNLLQQQLLQGQDNTGSNAMMKSLASSFLASESTVLEYDLKQAKGMQGGLLFNMCFMWLLHFKMEQIQPLMVTTASGLINLVYSPLFQVYVLGRNLERPFKNPAMDRYQQAQQQAAQAQADKDTTQADATTETTTDEVEMDSKDDADADEEENDDNEEEEESPEAEDEDESE